MTPGKTIVLDATVILNFARADAMDVLMRGLPGRLAVGLLVVAEVPRWPKTSSRSGQRLSLRDYVTAGQLQQVAMTEAELEEFQRVKASLRTGNGETEAIVLAASRGWAIATDDDKARRRVGRLLKAPVITGTIGLLRELTRAGALPVQDAKDLLVVMRERGAWLPDEGL